MYPGTLVDPYPNPYRPPEGLKESSDLAAARVSLAEELLAVNNIDGLAAVIVDSYLGQGGDVVPPGNFFPLLRDLANMQNALLVLDEIQSGMGRTGSMFAFQQLGIEPDLLALGKGLGGGVPITAVLGRREHLSALPPGRLWSTFGGNPFCCAAAQATLDVLETPGLLERVGRIGDHVAAEIASWKDPGIGDIRHMGMSFGIELVKDRSSKEPDAQRAFSVLLAAGRHGLIVLPPSGRMENVLRMAPPLTISDEDIRDGLRMLHDAPAETA